MKSMYTLRFTPFVAPSGLHSIFYFILASCSILAQASDLECRYSSDKLRRRSMSVEDRLKFRNHYEHLRLAQMEKMRIRNAKALASLPTQALEIDVLTFNTGLLWNPFIAMARVPDAHIRAPLVVNALRGAATKSKNPVLLLQEVWHARDQQAMAKMAEEENLHWLNHVPTSGLGFLVSKELGALEVLEFIPAQRSWGEWFVGLKKGIQPALLHLQNGKKLLLLNAHFAYSQDNTALRLSQVEQIKSTIQSIEHDYVVLGADTNSSDRFQPDKAEVSTNFLFDREVYYALTNSALLDSYAMMNPTRDGFTQNPYTNPLAAAGPTTATEPAQRLDYVMFSAQGLSQMASVASDLIFHQPVLGANGQPLLSPSYSGQTLAPSSFRSEVAPQGGSGGELFLSDHYGVTSRLVLF